MYEKNLVCSWYALRIDGNNPVGRVYLNTLGYSDTCDCGPNNDPDTRSNTGRSYAGSGNDRE